MQWLGVLIVLGSLVVLFVQNRAPIIALQFLGTQTIAFPLAVWVVGFTSVGVLTGWCLAGLLQSIVLLNQQRLKRQLQDLQAALDESLESDVPSYANDRQNWVDSVEEDPDSSELMDDEFMGDAPGAQYDDRFDPSDSRSRPLWQPERDSSAGNAFASLHAQPPLNTPQPDSSRHSTVDAEYRVLVPPPPESEFLDEADPESEDLEQEDWDFEDDQFFDDWDTSREFRSSARDRW